MTRKYAFVSDDIRDAIIEECAKVAEDAIPSIREHYGIPETVGAQVAAGRIRDLMSSPRCQ